MGRKRGVRGRGTVYQRPDGLWVGALSQGYELGKRRRYKVYSKTAEGVDRKLGELKRKIARGELPGKRDRDRLGPFLTSWLEMVVKKTRSASTYDDYERQVRKHIEPAVGHLAIVSLTPRHVDQLQAQLENNGVGARTRLKVHVLLHAAYQYAMRRDLVERNPLDRVDAPKYRAQERKPYSVEEIRKLLKAARGDRLEALLLLAVFTGLRQGELLGLQRDDVDLRHGALYIQRSLQNTGGHRALVPAKTATSHRRIDLPPICIDALRRHFEHSKKTTTYVFYDAKGGAFQRQNLVRDWWEPLLERAKLRPIAFHDLRHGAATMLLQSGVDVHVAQRILGHSSVGTTTKTYLHLVRSLQKDATARLEGLVTGVQPKIIGPSTGTRKAAGSRKR